MQEVQLGDRVVGPVNQLGALEDDSGILLLIRILKGFDMELVNYCAFKPIRAGWFGDILRFAGRNLHTKSIMSSKAVIDPRWQRRNAMGIRTSFANASSGGVELGQA